MLLETLTDKTCNDILLDIGMPVEHGQNRYNWYAPIVKYRITLISSQSNHSLEWPNSPHPPKDATRQRCIPAAAEIFRYMGHVTLKSRDGK